MYLIICDVGGIGKTVTNGFKIGGKNEDSKVIVRREMVQEKCKLSAGMIAE